MLLACCIGRGSSAPSRQQISHGLYVEDPEKDICMLDIKLHGGERVSSIGFRLSRSTPGVYILIVLLFLSSCCCAP
jgi:hypothetical protein